MKTFIWKDLDSDARKAALARPENRRDPAVAARVKTIFDDIEARGFAGLSDWAVRLDGHAPDAVPLNAKTVDAARAQLTAEDLAAMELAVENVRAFQQAELPGEGP
ncbi:MAG: histidinol dehydrogenase, partial [Asticcacaulis sp.]|nr:histidinol dehydrogenase [Asticcacaulis sp.]